MYIIILEISLTENVNEEKMTYPNVSVRRE